MSDKFQFWIDRGGTFTDIVAVHPDGHVTSHKYLSENPGQYDDAALFGMRDIMGLSGDAPFPSAQVASIKMGTTVATNALLEREGERTLFLTSLGCRDIVRIGDQRRPKLFELDVKATLPGQLYERVEEVAERLSADGEVITPLDESACRLALIKAHNDGLKAVAIGFLHAYLDPAHEDRAAEIAREVGFEQVTTSTGAARLVKFLPRAETAIADAYLSPILYRYIRRVEKDVGNTPLYFMQSSGGVARAGHFSGKDAILSGPAGGIVGAAESAAAAGFKNIVSFDMGGTSSDVAHYSGTYERANETEVAGVHLKVPMLDIHTVAAGGGSICSYKDGAYRVGPQSAGAYPGPACYGNGGPLTVSDCNLIVGHLQASTMPRVFGPKGNAALDMAAALARAEDVARQIEAATGQCPSAAELAFGFLQVANEHMSRAIKKISVERGHNIKTHAMVAFGGAGGQHATSLAGQLGISTVLVHPLAGVLSALGIGLARTRTVIRQSVGRALDPSGIKSAAAKLDELSVTANDSLESQGVAVGDVDIHRILHLRYQGSDTALEVAAGTIEELRRAFERAHLQLFGFVQPDVEIIIEAVEVEAASGTVETPALLSQSDAHAQHANGQIYNGHAYIDAPIIARAAMTHIVDGPAIIADAHGTTLVGEGWQAQLLIDGSLRLDHVSKATSNAADTALDPVLLEIFNNRFMGVAEQMGATLERTAHSVNMKERLDFSCAVFDAHGGLVANAPHMPVHLGSMGESVASVAKRNNGKLKPGDAIMLNDPYHGGTHLPDVTVVMPVFLDGDTAPSYFVASRGHHADIGGTTPGSMPSNSVHIDEEGVLLDNVYLLREGILQEDDVRQRLLSARYPARNPDQNLADLKAQIASCDKGIRELRRMCDEFGRQVVSAYMHHVQDNAENAVRRLLATLQGGQCRYPLDNGAVICVAVDVDNNARTATIDFTGTSPQMQGNYNAPKAVTGAAVLYVLRALVGEDIPLNAGCLAPIKMIVPEGSLINPTPPAAVVAGNVETSQAMTNCLLLALGKLGASQGTMNNFTFGNDRVQYYETIAGGSGAGDGFDGASATQVHMTNSKLTDVEILEKRYPVRVVSHALRANSGGSGNWSGGNGTSRVVEFLEDMQVSILSGHREIPPPGCLGGTPGGVGVNRVIRGDGREEQLGGTVSLSVYMGDKICIDTPGGGGYGGQ